MASRYYYDRSSDESSTETSSSSSQLKFIIVGNFLPVKANLTEFGWEFTWEMSLLLQLKGGFPAGAEVVCVGCLKQEIPLTEQESVKKKLSESFNCFPAFFPPDLWTNFYQGFCKQLLWPLMHSVIPSPAVLGCMVDRSLWEAYVSVNKIFADVVMEVINPDKDYIWVHDYHLMALPKMLRSRFNQVKLGFFLHSPFPSSEIYTTLPNKEDILEALLNCDIIGFQTLSYAEHFLSCCKKMFGLSYQLKGEYIALEYLHRTVSIKIIPVGVHVSWIESVKDLSDTVSLAARLRNQFWGKTVILGVDDMDIFKGIDLKLLAMEQLLILHPDKQGKVVLVQILNPTIVQGEHVQELYQEINATATRINEKFGCQGYEPVILIDSPLKFYERVAYYVIAECCLVTPVRDGMNVIPFEYVLCRQGNEKLDQVMGLNPKLKGNKKSMLVLSEGIGSSELLSGAVIVNPRKTESVAFAVDYALSLSDAEKRMIHEKHYKYIYWHNIDYWASSFYQDFGRACRDQMSRRCSEIEVGLDSPVLPLDSSFRKLSIEHIVSSLEDQAQDSSRN